MAALIDPQPLSVALAGILAGVAHAMLGPDHLAGVAPLVARAGRRAAWVGLAWGLGHAGGALLAALLALALRSRVPGLEQQLSLWAEFLVGCVLVGIGLLGLRSALALTLHQHPRTVERGTGAALALGTLHGAAGLSHLVGVLPSLALPGRVLPWLYLGGYAAGSLGAIVLVAACLGRCCGPHGVRQRRLLAATSVLSLAVGLVWMIRGA